MAEEKKWITVKGASIPLDEEGNLQGKVGKKIEKETEISEKKQKIKNALQEIADGKEEVTLPKLRDDLEQYGGTNDITLIKGNKKEGIIHIIENGREHYLGDILDTVVEGKVERYVQGNNSVVLQKGNIQAVLALERFREKKTWLLTGWDITTDRNKEKQEYLKKKGLVSDEQGKFGARHLPTQTEPIRSRFCLGADKDLIKIINNIKKKSTDSKSMSRQNIIMDSASKRSIDRNGFMHVEKSNLTKESVDPYFGYEIPNSQSLGLDPNKIYFGYRKGEEIAKGAKTFNGLPLMREHHLDHAENPQREHRVGAVGTNCEFNSPYLQASLTITDAEAIRKIETGERMELSASYYFVPVLEKGEFNGQPYDFVMTEIQGNHVALVEEGRAGADVCVADSMEPVKNVLDNNITTIKKDNSMEEKKEEKAVVDSEVKTACDNEGIVEAEKKAEDDELDIDEVLQSAGLAVSEDLKKAFIAGMHYAGKAEQAVEPVTVDSEITADSEVTVEDNEIETEKKESPAMDTNSIKKALQAEMREIQTAVRDVRSLVGELDAVAFDSTEDVYLKACQLMNVTASKKSARDVCRALAQNGKTAVTGVAMDSVMDYGFKSRFDA